MGGQLPGGAKRMHGTVVAVIGVDTCKMAEFKCRKRRSKGYEDVARPNFAAGGGSLGTLLNAKARSGPQKWIGERPPPRTRRWPSGLMRDMCPRYRQLQRSQSPVPSITPAGRLRILPPHRCRNPQKRTPLQSRTIEEVGLTTHARKPRGVDTKMTEV